jgi:glycosyltransferase involved in cell wall biosynthesis
MNEPVKILFILPYITQTNGILSFCWAYLDKIDRSSFHPEVVSTDISVSDKFIAYCKTNSIPLYLLPSPKTHSIFTYLSAIKRFCKQHHDYDIVHCNVTNYGYFYLKYEKRYGVPVRILHSHSRVGSAVPWKNFLDNIIKHHTLKKANLYFACSNLAGSYLFGKRPFHVITNAIDFSDFSKNQSERNRLRNELNIPQDTFVIGVMARLAPHKNPLFSLRVFYEFQKNEPNSLIIFVGSGELSDGVKQEAERLSIGKKIMLTGPVSAPENWYRIFDFCLLPSLSEGFGTSVVEAEANEIPEIVSTEVPPETIFMNNVIRLDLNSGEKAWADQIKQIAALPPRVIKDRDAYDISVQVKELEALYLSEYEKRKQNK